MDVVEVLGAATSRQGVLSRQELRAAGVSDAALSRAVARDRVLRVRRRVYALDLLPPLPRFLVTEHGVHPDVVPVVRAALLELGPRAAAAGRTAAVLHGWGLLHEPRRAVEVVVPHGHDCSPLGVRVRQARHVHAVDLVPLRGLAPLPVTTAVQTVLDCALVLRRLDATVVADRSSARAARGRRHARRAAGGRRTAAWPTRGCARSARRRRLRPRVRIGPRVRAAGAHGARRARRLRDAGRPAGRACAPRRLLLRRSPSRRGGRRRPLAPDPVRDQQRDNALAGLGWRVLRFTWHEVVHDSARVLVSLRSALEAGCTTVHLAAEAG